MKRHLITGIRPSIVAAIIAVAALAAAACGSSTASPSGNGAGSNAHGATSSGGSTAASQPQSSEARIADACTLLTAQDATTAMGDTASAPTASGPEGCGYSSNGGTVSIHLLYGQGSAGVEAVRSGAKSLEGYQDVTGVGDTAFLYGNGQGGQLFFAKNSVVVTIVLAIPLGTEGIARLTALGTTLAGRL